jgi:hypothetical protein
MNDTIRCRHCDQPISEHSGIWVHSTTSRARCADTRSYASPTDRSRSTESGRVIEPTEEVSERAGFSEHRRASGS